MERIYVVAVGGNADQPVEGKYVGADGAKAQAIFDYESQDGENSIVRLFPFPEHSQVRTPRRDGVPPKPRTSAVAGKKGKGKGKPPAADAAPASAEEEADGEQPEDSGV